MKDTLLCGDCAEKMRDLADNSIDAIVTDPPYGLAFMGKDWDHGVPGEVFWREALRVAKPGAHLLAFGGTRTYHRLACAIEDAGWEVRDCIMWVYGSGFPKSLDVSKAIDKAMGAEREKVRIDASEVRNPKSINNGHGVKGGDRPWMQKALERGYHEKDGNTPATPEAAAWNGWGTCLKPAVEPIVVARKPLEGTVAANVLKHGTGAINIDGCRVPTETPVIVHSPARKTLLDSGHKDLGTWENNKGRFPANLIHDGSPEVLACFPDVGKSSGGGLHTKGKGDNQQGVAYGKFANGKGPDKVGFGDSGPAARFFYCAKASRSERGKGNIHPTVKPLALMRYLVRLVTRKGGIVLDPFMGSGTTGVAALQEGMNFVGIERDPHYYDIASRRIAEAKQLPPTTTQQELPL